MSVSTVFADDSFRSLAPNFSACVTLRLAEVLVQFGYKCDLQHGFRQLVARRGRQDAKTARSPAAFAAMSLSVNLDHFRPTHSSPAASRSVISDKITRSADGSSAAGALRVRRDAPSSCSRQEGAVGRSQISGLLPGLEKSSEGFLEILHRRGGACARRCRTQRWSRSGDT
jgi:hypothetical protein